MRSLMIFALVAFLAGTLTAHADSTESKSYIGFVTDYCSTGTGAGGACFTAPAAALGHSVSISIADDHSAHVGGGYMIWCSFFGGSPQNCPGDPPISVTYFCDGFIAPLPGSTAGIAVKIQVNIDDPVSAHYDCGDPTAFGTTGTITATWQEG